MGGPFVDYDSAPDVFSLIADNIIPPKSKNTFRDLIYESYGYIIRYLSLLPRMDQEISKFYYIHGMSQEQIAQLFEISQAAVSRRLKYTTSKIKFLLKMPSLNPLQVRKDFTSLFPDTLFEFAYFFYWEFAQDRVKYFIGTSQSGAANKFNRILAYLEDLALSTDSKDLDVQQRNGLALIYLDYFRFIRRRSNVITFLYKKNDSRRSKSLTIGESVTA